MAGRIRVISRDVVHFRRSRGLRCGVWQLFGDGAGIVEGLPSSWTWTTPSRLEEDAQAASTLVVPIIGPRTIEQLDGYPAARDVPPHHDRLTAVVRREVARRGRL